MKINLIEKVLASRPKTGNVKFIAVDGHAGSGKSTLAELLSKKFNAQIIHTDDFSGWENPLNWYPDVIEKVFMPISKGAKALSYKPVSWWEDHHPEKIVDQPVTEIMILEGTSSSRAEFRDYLSFSIFVDTPKEVCLQRGIQRDVAAGKPEEEVIKMWEKWFEEENTYFEREKLMENADFVLDGTTPFEEQIEI